MKLLIYLVVFTSLVGNPIANGQTLVVSGYGLESERKAVGEPISLKANHEELHWVLRQVARLAGKQLALEDGLKLDTPIYVSLKGVPWDLALDPILKSAQLQARLVDDIIVITKAAGESTTATAAKPQVSQAEPSEPDSCSIPADYTREMTKPRKLHTPQPRYTKAARREKLQGSVTVRGVIDCRGNFTDFTVVMGLPLGLSEATVEALSKWRFEPALLDGNPVATHYTVSVPFRLQ